MVLRCRELVGVSTREFGLWVSRCERLRGVARGGWRGREERGTRWQRIGWRGGAVSYTHLTLPTICSV
eukprot:3462118-Rhodomonas_salina.1